MRTAAAVLAAALTFILGLFLGGPSATADQSVVNDVRYGMFTLLDEMANRSTPTGRRGDDDLSLIIRQVVNEAIECNDLTGDPDCDPEGVPVP